MTMEYLQRHFPLLFFATFFIPEVDCASKELVGLAVAGSVSFVLLFMIIFMIAVSTSWSDWMKQWFRSRNRVKMPKVYWRKKEEAKRRLLMSGTSSVASAANGHLPAQTLDRASWVQGWSQRSNAYNEVYEEKDVALDFGPEADDEFKIETVLCDDEVLDVGPFKNHEDSDQPNSGDVYTDPYIYTMVDKTPRSSTKGSQGGTTQADVESVRGDNSRTEPLDVESSRSDNSRIEQLDVESGRGDNSKIEQLAVESGREDNSRTEPLDINVSNFEENLVKL